MRERIFAILAAIAIGGPGLAAAQPYPPDTLLSGEVDQKVASNQCYILRGGGDFLRNAAANRAYLSVPEMVAAGYELTGHMMLIFTSTSGGTVHFNYVPTYPSTIQVAPFTGYKQSFDAATKSVHAQFTINFPGCSLPVSGVYTSP